MTFSIAVYNKSIATTIIPTAIIVTKPIAIA